MRIEVIVRHGPHSLSRHFSEWELKSSNLLVRDLVLDMHAEVKKKTLTLQVEVDSSSLLDFELFLTGSTCKVVEVPGSDFPYFWMDTGTVFNIEHLLTEAGRQLFDRHVIVGETYGIELNYSTTGNRITILLYGKLK